MTGKQVHFLTHVGVYKRLLGQVLPRLTYAQYSDLLPPPQPRQMVRAPEHGGLIREHWDLAQSIHRLVLRQGQGLGDDVLVGGRTAQYNSTPMAQFSRILRGLLQPAGGRLPQPWRGRSQLAAGRAAFASGDDPEAERHFVAALQSGADEGVCRLHLARIYNRNGRWEKALEQWSWLRDRDRDRMEPHLQVGRAQLRLGRYLEASNAFNDVLALAPDHAEAQQKLTELEAVKSRALSSTAGRQSAPKASTLANSLFENGRAAFNDQDFGAAERYFSEAITAGADEAASRLYLARIFNSERQWNRALAEWKWLRDRSPMSLEPRLQVARAQFRLDLYADAAAGFRSVLELAPEHAEARQTLERLERILQESSLAIAEGAHRNWLSLVPVDLRWRISSSLLAVSVSTIEATVDHLVRHAASYDDLLRNYGEAEGELAAHRQLYSQQASAGVEELIGELDAAGRAVRALALRTEKKFETVEQFTGRSVVAAVPRPVEWRETVLRTGGEIYRTHGLDAALAWIWRQTLVEDRYSVLTALAPAVHRASGDDSVRLYWLAFAIAASSSAAAMPALSRELAAGFECLVERLPHHVEARQSLQRTREFSRGWEVGGTEESRRWLDVVPPASKSWLSAKPLALGLTAIETLLDRAVRQSTALLDLLGDYGDADGELSGHRQLYVLQAEARVDDCIGHLKQARRRIRALGQRAGQMVDSVASFDGGAAVASGPNRALARAEWRQTVTKIAADVYRSHGFDAALAWIFRDGIVEDRPAVLADLGTAVRELSREDAVSLYWLSYGAKPSPLRAEQTAARMFQAGDLTSSSALVAAGPKTTTSPFVAEMRSSISMFRAGVEIPPPASGEAAASQRLVYVASGSLPFQIAGYTIRTHQLLKALVASGVDAVCLTRPGYPWDRPRALAGGHVVEEKHEIDAVTYMHTQLDGESGGEDLILRASDALERRFRALGVGIVQAASNSRNALPALIAARRIGVKFIYEVRGLWELTAASRFSGWEETERYRLDRDLEVLIASHADHVLTITQGVAEELMAGGVSPDRLSLLPNAVDPESFRPMLKDPGLLERLQISQNEFVIVYAGSLTAYEGLDDVIAALPRLLQAGIEPRFIVAGDGEYRQRMQALATNLGVADRVTFAGRVKPEEIRAYLSLADVVTIPRKPFKVCMVVSPLKPFEAMAMEKAVVLSDLPALREIVEDGKTGLICKAANPVDLAAVLERLARQPDLRGELGRAARRWVVEKRSWEQNAANLRKLYQAMTNDCPVVMTA